MQASSTTASRSCPWTSSVTRSRSTVIQQQSSLRGSADLGSLPGGTRSSLPSAYTCQAYSGSSMTASTPERPYLIVNADDYGYFACVSKGILKSATHGVVTATGVFANSIHFGEHAAWLRECDALDAGVHLNLTDGIPLTSDLQKMLGRWSGRFPRKFALAKAILSGAIKVDAVKREWRAQIERCLAHGLKLRFLNSHEHMHMLPSLFPVAKALAHDYDIRHIRFPTSQLARSS